MTNLDHVVFVSDFFLGEYNGGAEMVDNTIAKSLNIKHIRTRDVSNVDPNKTYLLSNTYHLKPYIKAIFKIYENYLVFEHDYKIHPSRQPNLFKDNIIPPGERVNYDYYKHARIVFLQTEDHKECFVANEVPGSFEVLHTSIWSKDELDLLEKFSSKEKSYKAAVVSNPHPAKGTPEAVEYCAKNSIEYDLIPPMPKDQFYDTLAGYSKLIYFPSVKESFCRLVVEARALGLEVISSDNYGVTKENWYKTVDKKDILGYLSKGSEEALKLIRSKLE